MLFRLSCVAALFAALFTSRALAVGDDTVRNVDKQALPKVPEGFQVQFIAREPLVHSPCAMAFDRHGRLFVGMGPQYRNPAPDTPGDSIYILTDSDHDGILDTKIIFATGLNSIQGLAWHGRDLWIANAPDLTIARDLDGDEVADQYVKVYTDLGNLEHALHGLTFAPDGRLYMSKGNSKGYTRADHPLAPKPFRDLWGVQTPKNSGGEPPVPIGVYKAAEYKHDYHTPADDWGREGGILRCDPDGRNLQIVSRGFRNPWDIAADSQFNWLGTDNDQNDGDRIFMPFFGAHFGWGHVWSSHWTGENHLPTAPISGPVFKGSGTGIIYYTAEQFPPQYRNIYFINDWLFRQTYVYRPRWDGALMQPVGSPFKDPLLDGAAANALYRPTDIEIAPDGALIILGWGVDYGATLNEKGEMQNEGRIARLIWSGNPVPPRDQWHPAKRDKPMDQWTIQELIDDLGAPIPAWRIDAADELVRRGATSKDALISFLTFGKITDLAQTWAIWTLGRLSREDMSIDVWLGAIVANKTAPFNLRLQAIRILGFRKCPPFVVIVEAMLVDALKDSNPRIRHEAVQALWQADRKTSGAARAIADLAAVETDRVVFYSAWHALNDLLDESSLKALLKDPRPGVRRAALLALAESARLNESDARPLVADPDPATAQLAALWIAKQTGNNLIEFDPPSKSFDGPLKITITAGLKPSKIYYTLDGSEPTKQSKAFNITLELTDTATIRARLFVDGQFIGPVAIASYRKESAQPVGPPLIQPLATPTTIPQAIAALKTGDPVRGRALFAAPNGAGCINCHRLGDQGRFFGPELTGIGQRGSIEQTVQSILDPSAIIAEGFALQSVTTKDGKSFSGILKEQTGSNLTLALVDGSVAVIRHDNIAAHQTLPVSVMPPFAAMLTPQQVADLVAFLNQNKGDAASDAPAPAATAAADAKLSLTLDNKTIHLRYAGKTIGGFHSGNDTIKRPYFANLKTLSGLPVTRAFPPVPGKDPVDHDTMHPGLWLGFGDISGQDFWRNKGKVKVQKLELDSAAPADQPAFIAEMKYTGEDKTELCTQSLRCSIAAQPAGYLILIDTSFKAGERDIYFGDQEEMGCGLRIATPLIEKNGGVITNSAGQSTAKKTWGQPADWSDYSGQIDGKPLGATLMAAPSNFRKSWFHNRDYGLMVANPFGQKAMKQGPASKVELKKGDTLRLRFGVYIHEGNTNPAVVFQQYRELLGR